MDDFDLFDVTTSSDTTRRFVTRRELLNMAQPAKGVVHSYPESPVPPWPYGTILRPKVPAGSVDRRRIMVVLDTGSPSFSAVMVRSATTREVGDIRHNYARDRWTPE